MDVFNLLKKDHREVKALFKKIEGTSATKTREKLFQQVAQALTLHTELEEELVYPRLREQEKLKNDIDEAYEEHHVAKLLMDEIAQSSAEDERWQAKVTVLKEMVEHHVQEEEKEVFPRAARALGKDAAKELGKQVKAEKEQRMKGMRRANRSARSGAGAEMRA